MWELTLMPMFGCFGRPSKPMGKKWTGHNQFILLHLEGCNPGMGGEFHAISPQLHICHIGGSFV